MKSVIVVVALLALMVGCEAWKWGECKKVGHGTFYCLTKVGGKD